ncbi:MAG TPA: hypothetical protein VJ767_05280 [Nitrososphaeraceae archaeon]|nr:hypothetical protein [Nitrososphaeraceae archaeon]
MVLNDKFHSVFIENIINCNQSIRWVGITDHDGTIINERVREGLKLLLTKEENNEFAKNSITRHKARIKFESKMGKLIYAFRRYENMSRCIIPINENYYVFLTMDFEECNFDNIIMEKIIPLIQKEKRNL